MVLALALGGCGGHLRPAQSAPAPTTSPGPTLRPARPGQRLPLVEVGLPTNPADSYRGAGALILIHGGGWVQTGARYLTPLVAAARHFNALGWETFNTDYRPTADSLTDVLAVYDAVRAKVGARVPICALGYSAGGNLALLLAARRPELACVISLAGPTDLALLDHPGLQAYPYVRALAASLGGAIARWSPVNLAADIRARVLLLYAGNDPLVPPSQGSELQARLPSARLTVLAAGTVPFVHSYVRGSDLTAAVGEEDALLAEIAGRAGRG